MTTEERLDRMEKMLGVKFLGMDSAQLKAELKPENQLDGGRYPYMLSDYQLHVGVDEVKEWLKGPIDNLGPPIPPQE